MLRHIDDNGRRVGLLADLGDICTDHLGEYERAIRIYNAQIDLDASNIVPFRRLETLLTPLDRPQELIEVLGKLVGFGAQNNQLVEDLLKLGQAQIKLEA
ncbi:MAG: hypothetical protein R3C68_14875 [Myxococcota bacterium]